MPPLWALALGAALLLGALLLSLAIFAPRRRVRSAQVSVAIAGAGAPLLPPTLDDAATFPPGAHSALEADEEPGESPGEELSAEPAEIGPVIVPVLEADIAPTQPEEL
jgi:hypothetical protein